MSVWHDQKSEAVEQQLSGAMMRSHVPHWNHVTAVQHRVGPQLGVAELLPLRGGALLGHQLAVVMVVVAGLEVKQEPGVGKGLCLALVPACAALLMLAPHILAAARNADELKGHMHKDLRHCTVKLKQQQQQQLYLGATDAAVLPAAVAAAAVPVAVPVAVAAAAVTPDAVAPAAVPVAVPAAVEVHAAAVEPDVQTAAATWPGPAADASAVALAPQPVSAAAPAAAPEVAAAGHAEQVARREGASAGTAAALGLYQFLPVS